MACCAFQGFREKWERHHQQKKARKPLFCGRGPFDQRSIGKKRVLLSYLSCSVCLVGRGFGCGMLAKVAASQRVSLLCWESHRLVYLGAHTKFNLTGAIPRCAVGLADSYDSRGYGRFFFGARGVPHVCHLKKSMIYNLRLREGL